MARHGGVRVTLGRTASNAIKIKTDGGTTRAVECACCGCDFPPVCLNGSYPNNGWVANQDACFTRFLGIAGCGDSAPPVISNDPFFQLICGGAKWALLIAQSEGGACLGNVATNFYCKSDGIDWPTGTYSGYNYGGDGYLTFTVTEKLGESC